MRDESDIAWKEILDVYFKDFIDYCLPALSELINWKRKWVSLDKELQSITKNNKAGKRLLDKLFKAYLKDGKEQWILIHIEVQGKQENDFPKRMFTYAYRIYDKYQQPIVSCAILTDDHKEWRPTSYKVGIHNSYLDLEYIVIKIIDYQNKKAELDISNNPFASVILVQLAAIESKRKPDEYRKQIKFALTKRLYLKGYGKNDVINLFKFIEWLIGLPEPLELEYVHQVQELGEAKKMPHITPFERIVKRIVKEETIRMVALRLLLKGAKPTFIKEVTGLSLAKIKALQKNH